MLDADLAVLYGVETKVFNQAVRRNIERFPEDFMFQLAPDEASALRSQFVTLESLSRCLLLSTIKYSIVLFTMSDQICYQENLTM